MTSFAAISSFLKNSRIAFIGVSRNPADFTRQMADDFERRGYEVFRVNPGAAAGDRSWCTSIAEVSPQVSAALLFTPPAKTETVVRDCAAAGVRQIWMYRGMGTGAVNVTAVEFCREHDIEVIAGECPYMFFPGGSRVHAFHGFIRKLFGKYPR
jgi:predicted CoA-binding protein